jgi:hypothetical protein
MGRGHRAPPLRQGTYVPIDPERILDRDASFGFRRRSATTTFQVQVAGEGTVPAKGILAVMNHGHQPTASGFSRSPTGLTKGTVSNPNSPRARPWPT